MPENPAASAAGVAVSGGNRVPKAYSEIKHRSENFPKIETERVEPAAVAATTENSSAGRGFWYWSRPALIFKSRVNYRAATR